MIDAPLPTGYVTNLLPGNLINKQDSITFAVKYIIDIMNLHI